jgi:hypothetical protein
MLENLAKEFLSSSVAGDAVASLKQEAGLNESEATNALSATAEGAVGALGGAGGGLGDMVGGLLGGGGGAAGMLGGLLGGGGGGGAAGMLGGLLGGGGGGAAGMLGGMLGGGASTGLPPAVTDTIVNFVADKTGLGADKARMAVNVVLPKIVAFAKSKLG